MQLGAFPVRVVLLMLALLCWSAQGRAEGSPEIPTEVLADPGQLSEALRQGVEAYDRGDLETARRAFELVHARAPTARTLRSLGLVAFRQERYEDAVALLEASLASQAKPLTDAQREGAGAVAREARAKVPAPSEPAAPAPAALTPAAVEVLPAPAQAARPQHIERSPSRSVAHSVAVTREQLRSRRLKRAGYALLGVAGAALITSITSYQVGLSRLHKIEATCREGEDPGCDLAYVQKREQSANLDALGTLSLVSGIAAGLAGASGTAVLLWRWRSEHDTAARAEIGLGWKGVF